jgi:uncharacterized protein YllA (UPF0747 family)
VLKNTHHNLTLGSELKAIQAHMDEISGRANKIDKTLTGHIAAKAKWMSQALEGIEKKMLRAEKRLHKDKLAQIEFVKDILFPKGKLQERYDNFLSFAQKDPAFVSKMIEALDPFDFRFNVIIDD